MKQIRTLFGLEAELRSEVFRPDGKRHADALDALEASCFEGLPHLVGEERGVFLASGGNWYREAAGGYTHQEFSTPECTTPSEAVLHMQAGYLFARRGADRFVQQHGGRACFSRNNVCYSAGTSWGNHECHCMQNNPETCADALFSHLATRNIYAGSGGFAPRSAGLEFVLSSRAPFIGAVTSGSTEGPSRALFHKDYKSPRGHGGWYRAHLIVGDGLCSERSLWLRTATTALIVALADYNRKPEAAAQVAEPLAALHTINADPSLKAAVPCKDGKLRTAIDIQRELLLAHVERHVEILPLWAPEAVTEWRRVLDDLANHGLGGLARSHDAAIKWDLYTDLLAQRGFSWDDVSGKTGRATGAGKADVKRLRAEMMLLDTRFPELSENGLFEILDSQPALLDHRVPRVKERIEWAIENPPPDTRAAARGAIVKQFYGTQDAGNVRVGWSFGVELSSGKKIDLSNPFNPHPSGLDEFLQRRDFAKAASEPHARRTFRDLIGF